MTTTIPRSRAVIATPSLPPTPQLEYPSRPGLASRILHIFLPVPGDDVLAFVREAERTTSLRVLTTR